MRVKLTAKHPRPTATDRAPVRAGSPSGRKPVRASAPARPTAGAEGGAHAAKRTQGTAQKTAARPAHPRGAAAPAKPGYGKPASGKPFGGERRGPASGKPSGPRAAADKPARPSTRPPYAERSAEPRRAGTARTASSSAATAGPRPARARTESAAPRGERGEQGLAPRRRERADDAAPRIARPVKRAAAPDERRGPPTGRPPRGEARSGATDAPRQRRDGDTRGGRPARASYEERSASTPKRPPAKRGERGPLERERPGRAAPTGRRNAAAPARDDDALDGTVRLSKRMSELGLCSRREADEWIENGWVRVDGERIDTLGARIRPEQQIEISSDARASQARQVTILLNKPVGFVSGQAEDGYAPAITLIKPENRWDKDRSPLRFVPSHLRTLAPAGRLDIDSTGLLVLTQDGRIAKLLIGEHSGVEKEYLVRVTYGERETDIDQHFPPEKLALLRHGLSLDGAQLKPAKVSWQNGEQLRFVLREGKKRQIRRMCELVGLHVVGLKRVRMGRVALGQLPQGQWRYLLPDEVF